MELVKNIFFNTDKLVENSNIKISYTGKFFQDNSEEVFIHYGFGLNWDNVSEIEMEKTELGFQCEIDILAGETLNLCFKNNANVWDNNFGQNFVFPIEEKQEQEESETSLVLAGENEMQMHKGLRRSYIWSKKIKLAVYKIIKYFPKIISGNYKRKINEE